MHTSGFAPRGSKSDLRCFPLFPHEVTDDAELVRIAAGVGDEELAVHAMSLTQRRAEQNPSLLSCRAALSHSRGIWSESVDDLRDAAQALQEGTPTPRDMRPPLRIWGKVLTQSRRRRVGNRSLRRGTDRDNGSGRRLGLGSDPSSTPPFGGPTTTVTGGATENWTQLIDHH